MDYKKLQNGSDIRGVALEGIEGQHVNLTEKVCVDIGRGFALWLIKKTGKTDLTVAVDGCGTFLQIHAFQHSILAIFLFNIQHRLLQVFFLL